MGIQISVELKDLPAAFSTKIVADPCDANREVLIVTFPSGKEIESYFIDGLVFDNKTLNMDLREELDNYAVPYRRS